jgi:hypothetical protein
VVVSSSPIFSVHFALGKVIVELQKNGMVSNQRVGLTSSVGRALNFNRVVVDSSPIFSDQFALWELIVLWENARVAYHDRIV